MRLTQGTDYALRVLMFLADRDGMGATAPEIAEAHGLSTGLVRKAMQALKKHGFLITQRGRGRRSHLVDAPSEIAVGAVVRALETLDIVECFDPERDSCQLSGSCALAHHLRQARQAFLNRLDQTTLLQLSSGASAELAAVE